MLLRRRRTTALKKSGDWRRRVLSTVKERAPQGGLSDRNGITIEEPQASFGRESNFSCFVFLGPREDRVAAQRVL